MRFCSSDQFIELELPPDFGNGSWNAGIPLARLLWHVPVQGLMTLLAALLLERRVILVAEDRDKVSAAVHAAAALLYPFRWQHIYLPLLPIALKVSSDKQAGWFMLHTLHQLTAHCCTLCISSQRTTQTWGTAALPICGPRPLTSPMSVGHKAVW